MENAKAELRKGIKTFFVVPDTSLVNEYFLEEFFLNGFESYFLENDQTMKLEKKIDILFDLFEQVILFFNIDFKIQGLNWPQFIAKVQKKYENRALIGVTYLKTSEEKSRQLEHLYLYDIGIVCGCIQLTYKKAQNLQLLNTVLMLNQANGVRKSIRAVCSSLCKIDINYEGKNVLGILRDISVSHFTCVFPDVDPKFGEWTRVDDIFMNLHGFHCNVSALNAMQRDSNGHTIYVFLFIDSSGSEGLDAITKQKVNKYVFKQISEDIDKLLQDAYKNARFEEPRRENEKLYIDEKYISEI